MAQRSTISPLFLDRLLATEQHIQVATSGKHRFSCSKVYTASSRHRLASGFMNGSIDRIYSQFNETLRRFDTSDVETVPEVPPFKCRFLKADSRIIHALVLKVEALQPHSVLVAGLVSLGYAGMLLLEGVGLDE